MRKKPIQLRRHREMNFPLLGKFLELLFIRASHFVLKPSHK